LEEALPIVIQREMIPEQLRLKADLLAVITEYRTNHNFREDRVSYATSSKTAQMYTQVDSSGNLTD